MTPTDVKTMNLDQVAAEIKDIRPKLSQAFKEAGYTPGGSLDMDKVTVFGEKDSHAKSVELANMNMRLTELGEKQQELLALKRGADELDRLAAWMDTSADRLPPNGGKAYEPFAKAATPFLDRIAAGEKRFDFTIPGSAKEWVDREMKTVMSTGAGFAPQNIRSGLVVPAAYQAPTVIDLLPTVETDQAAYVFMRQTTRTNSAAEVSESTNGSLQSLAESAFVWTEITEPIRRVGHFIPVTDQQLKFIQGMRDLLAVDMPSGVRERLSSQLLNGDGSSPNISGFLDSDRATQDIDCTGEFIADAVDKLIEKVATVGFAEADGIILNRGDWHGYRRATTADGIYIAGHPSDNIAAIMWGLPVALTTEIAAGNALVGAFQRYSALALGSGIEMAISTEHASYFIQGLQAVRAEVYAGLVVKRETAFAKTNDIVVS